MNESYSNYYPIEKVRPSLWYVAFGVMVGVFGTAVFIWFLYDRVIHMADDFQRVVVPGRAVMEFRGPGNYTIFHEYRSVVGGRIFGSDDNIAGLQIRLVKLEGYEEIFLEETPGRSSYEFEDRDGYSLYDFNIIEPGSYLLEAWYPGVGSSATGKETVLAVGRDFMKRLLTTVIISIVIMVVSWVLAVIIIITTMVKRKRNRQEVLAYQSGRPHIAG
nr:hypothetical protein [candidate division Zixibacteria bacterium]